MIPATPLLESGVLIGSYRIIGPLGGGGMGMVYRAVHVLLGRPAAIKVLRPEIGNCPAVIDRFLIEARATTVIRHPGIVEIYDYGHTEAGNAYIAMELLEGRTLAACLFESGRPSVFEAMTLLRRIAAPLAVAHGRGIVHRDLKPENVFLIRDPDGGAVEHVKILDFGIAKLEDTAVSNRTTMGLILGTPAYMSPEQCRGAATCDHRSDLYSLGCIAFELLTGRPLFGEVLTSAEMMAAHLGAPVPDIARVVAIQPRLAHLVTRLLAKRPDDRPRNALEVIAELDHCLSTTRDRDTAFRRQGSRSLLLIGGVLAVLLALLGTLRLLRSTVYETDAPAATTSRSYVLSTPPQDAAGNLDASPLHHTTQVPPIDATVADAAPIIYTNSVLAPPRTAPSVDGRSKARAADVTSDLGKANNGDVNTIVMDPGP